MECTAVKQLLKAQISNFFGDSLLNLEKFPTFLRSKFIFRCVKVGCALVTQPFIKRIPLHTAISRK